MADNKFVPVWEKGCFDRSHEAWIMLLGAYKARDLAAKIVYIEQLTNQLGSWHDLLTMRKEEQR